MLSKRTDGGKGVGGNKKGRASKPGLLTARVSLLFLTLLFIYRRRAAELVNSHLRLLLPIAV